MQPCIFMEDLRLFFLFIIYKSRREINGNNKIPSIKRNLFFPFVLSYL